MINSAVIIPKIYHITPELVVKIIASYVFNNRERMLNIKILIPFIETKTLGLA